MGTARRLPARGEYLAPSAGYLPVADFLFAVFLADDALTDPDDFFANTFLADDLLTDLLADDFFADDFLADDFLADDFLADDFLADDFLADAFFEDAFFEDDLLADDFFAAGTGQPSSCEGQHQMDATDRQASQSRDAHARTPAAAA